MYGVLCLLPFIPGQLSQMLKRQNNIAVCECSHHPGTCSPLPLTICLFLILFSFWSLGSITMNWTSLLVFRTRALKQGYVVFKSRLSPSELALLPLLFIMLPKGPLAAAGPVTGPHKEKGSIQASSPNTFYQHRRSSGFRDQTEQPVCVSMFQKSWVGGREQNWS